MCDDDWDETAPEPGVYYDDAGRRIHGRHYWNDQWGTEADIEANIDYAEQYGPSLYSDEKKRDETGLAPPIGNPMKRKAENVPNVTEARRKEIVTWLSASQLAEKVPRIDGFFLRRGIRVRLRRDEVCEIITWLDEEGIRPGKIIDGYAISANPEHPLFGDVLAFHRIVVPAPFERKEHDGWENDVPY